jgi:prophage antirepressor-like protein
MSAIQTFNFDADHPIRVIIGDDGEPRWIGTDVCRALGIKTTQNAYQRLDDDEKGVHTVDTPGGPQELIIINESGVYSLIMRSRTERAKAFRKWVTSEVLPAIRQTGRYEMVRTPATTLPIPERQYTAHELELINSSQRVAQTRALLAVIEEQEIQQYRLAQLEAKQKILTGAIIQTHDIATEAEQKATLAIHTANATNETLFNRTGWISVLGYSRQLGINLHQSKLASIGKIASKRCEERGITVQKINDARWGKVNIYPEEVLDSLKNEFIRRAG